MRVLLSGFEPFGLDAVNPTSLLMTEVREGRVAIPLAMAVQTVVLPVTFEGAFPRLKREIDAFDPDVVIAFGLAGGRDAIEFERVAINCMDAGIADNDGFQPRDLVIDDTAEPAYFATLPIRRLSEAVASAGLPSRISNTAGLYVCNRLMFELLRASAGQKRKCGFVHVPYFPEQVENQPTMSLAHIVSGLEVVLRECAGG